MSSLAPWKPGEPGYGVVEYADGRKHGAKPTSTYGWLTQSSSQSEPQEKP